MSKKSARQAFETPHRGLLREADRPRERIESPAVQAKTGAKARSWGGLLHSAGTYSGTYSGMAGTYFGNLFLGAQHEPTERKVIPASAIFNTHGYGASRASSS